MQQRQLINYLHKLLQVNNFSDYCPNGLQVAGAKTINKVITGVTACQALLDAAVKKHADTLLVHHGYFWRGEDPCITGIKHQRIATLLKGNLNLFAYHLPLDAHLLYGNNAQLGKRLGVKVTTILDDGLFYIGELPHALTATQLQQHITQVLHRQPQCVQGNDEKILTIAWCTGGAQDGIDKAAQYGVDAYLSGEICERTFHLAKELGINYFAAGHHATERYGVQALGIHLVQEFNLAVEFIDIENPV